MGALARALQGDIQSRLRGLLDFFDLDDVICKDLLRKVAQFKNA